MLQEAGRMKKYNYNFSKKPVYKGLSTMFERVMNMFDLAIEIFDTGAIDKITALHEMDKDVDMLKQKLSDSHVRWLKSDDYASIGGDHFYSAVCDLERIADHITNFASSMLNFAEEDEEEEAAPAIAAPLQMEMEELIKES
jgi:phosphate uptake regulator